MGDKGLYHHPFRVRTCFTACSCCLAQSSTAHPHWGGGCREREKQHFSQGPLGSPSVHWAWAWKDRWARSAAGRGLHPLQGSNPTPAILFCPRSELPNFPIGLSFPSFVKPNLSWSVYGGLGAGMGSADILTECTGPSYCIPQGQDLEGRCLSRAIRRMCPQCVCYPPVSLLAG